MKTFSEFQEAAFAIPAAAGVVSKVLPAAAATVGAIGTFLQAKKKGKDLIKPKKGEAKKTKKLIDKYKKTAKVIKPKEGEIAKQRELLSKLEKRVTKPKKGEKKDASKTVKNFLKARKKEGETMYKLKQDAEIADKGPGDLLPAAKKTYLNKMLDNLRRKKMNEAAFAIPAAAGVVSKVLPAAAATVGAVGTFLQARKAGKFTRKVMKGKVGKNQKVKPELLDAVRKKQAENKLKKEKGSNTSPDLMDAMKQKQAEVDKIRKKKGKIQGVNMSPTKNRVTDEIDAGVFKRGKIIDKETRRRMNAPENQFNSYDPLKEEVPTNNASSGNIAGLPPDSPPVKKNKRGSGMKNRKKKKYAYGGRGSRKMWMA